VKSLLLTVAQILFTFALYLLGILLMGFAAFPGAILFYQVFIATGSSPIFARILFLCFAAAAAYFLFGISLILVVGFLRTVLRLNLKEGEYPVASLGAAQWAFENSLTLIIAITFMDFILLTPLAPFLYRLMGAKVGRNVQLNSKYCADFSLLEIGDNSLIGGHATVICHSFERDRLILKKVKIGKNVVIGLNSVVLPGAEIGDGAIVAAGAIVPKNTKIEPRSKFLGPHS